VSSSDASTAALLQRLMEDSDFRARFRDDPEATLRELGMVDLFDEASTAADPMQTLQIRESRSSLAGAALAAAIEGFGLMDVVGNVVDRAGAAQPVPFHGAHPRPVGLNPGAQALSALEGGGGDDGSGDDQSEVLGSDHGSGAGADDDGSGDDSSDADSSDDGDSDDDSSDDDGSDDDGSDDDGSDDDGSDDDGSDDDSSDDDGSDDDSSDDEDSDDSSDNSFDDENTHDNSSDDGSSDDGSDDADSGDAIAHAGNASPDDFIDAGSAYPGDGAPPTAIAGWMAAAAERRGLPPELPVMAALTESGMRNLSYGDADSVGFFQMRESIWNRGQYAGYADDPRRQLNWFLDQAEAIRRVRVERDQSVTDPAQYGDWVADVERPAEQYRGRYQLHLEEAHALVARWQHQHGGSGGGGADQLLDVADGSRPAPGRQALVAVAAARRMLGTPYLWGGSRPSTGFDCSGLVQWAYAQAGVSIPRTTFTQIDAPGAQPVGRNDLMPGDLIFFRNSSGDVHHVGMSLGGDRFIEAPHTGDVVKIANLKEPYFAQEYAGARRFVPSDSGGVQDAAASRRIRERASEAKAVRLALAALDRDRAELSRPGSAMFEELVRQEGGKGAPTNAVLVLPAIDPVTGRPTNRGSR
jgi:cell wall-associated NlpC family hydrolase